MNTTYYKEAITRIDPDKYYTITEITKRQYILNTIDKADREYVAKLVRNKVIKSRNFSISERQPLRKVLGSDLIAYIQKAYL